jgi:hypothetical protein
MQAAAVVPLVEAEAVELRRCRSETLIQIEIVNAEGVLILKTVWGPPAHRTLGRRMTYTAIIAGEAQLIRVLAELVPTMISDLAQGDGALRAHGA